MTRAEFIDCHLPIIIDEYDEACRVVKDFRSKMISFKDPKLAKHQDDKFEVLKNRRDELYKLKARLKNEQRMWRDLRQGPASKALEEVPEM